MHGSNNMDTNSIDENRVQLQATVGKFDTKDGFAGPQRIIELKDIQLLDDSNVLFDSLWVNCGKWSSILKERHNIVFDARVNLKKKQKLERITKVSIIELEEDGLESQIRELINKSYNYGKGLWETTDSIDSIIIEIEKLNNIFKTKIWTEWHSETLAKLACKLIYSEWNSKSKDILSRLHEFVVWLKILIEEHIKDIDPYLRKEFYRNCMEQWFYFYQGE